MLIARGRLLVDRLGRVTHKTTRIARPWYGVASNNSQYPLVSASLNKPTYSFRFARGRGISVGSPITKGACSRNKRNKTSWGSCQPGNAESLCNSQLHFPSSPEQSHSPWAKGFQDPIHDLGGLLCAGSSSKKSYTNGKSWVHLSMETSC